MPAPTPVMGWTKTAITDKIAMWPGVMAAGIQDIEDSFFLPDDSINHSAGYNAWPAGLSVMRVTSAAMASANGWPNASSGYVVTIKIGTSAATQLHFANFDPDSDPGHPELRMRDGNANGWTPWTLIAGSGQPWAVWADSVTFANNSAATSKTIAFPAGLFTRPPVVTVSTHDSGSEGSPQSISTSGFTLAIAPAGGTGSMPDTRDRVAEWQAIQVY